MIRTTVVSVAIALASAAAPAQQMSPAEQAAMQEVHSCFTRQAISLDDGVSDARTVARAAIKGCSGAIDAIAIAGGLSSDAEFRRDFRRAFEEGSTDKVAGYVLQWRGVMRDVARASVENP